MEYFAVFLIQYGDLRLRHSFPTRRSSDLGAVVRQEEERDLFFPQPVNEPGRARDRLDRKSTRLNSSHANISYAVFCLKKKSSSLSLMRDGTWGVWAPFGDGCYPVRSTIG